MLFDCRRVGEQLEEFDSLVCEVMCNRFISMAIQWDEEDAEGSGSRASILTSSSSSSSSSTSTAPGESTRKPSPSSSSVYDALEQILRVLISVQRLQPALM